MTEELDPRWDWIEIAYFESDQSQYIRGMCKHLMSEREPVFSIVIDGEQVASLCRTCDAQLPPVCDHPV